MSQIVHVLKSDLKKSWICPIWCQTDPFDPKSDIPAEGSIDQTEKYRYTVITKILDTSCKSLTCPPHYWILSIYMQHYDAEILCIYLFVFIGYNTMKVKNDKI